MTSLEKEIEIRMAQMCISHPGYLLWDEADLKNHTAWIISVEEQIKSDLLYKQEGYV